MVNFIKPLYLGTEKEFANLYANPIKNGQHKDSGKKDITVMKQRSYVLHKKLSKFVQVPILNPEKSCVFYLNYLYTEERSRVTKDIFATKI